MENMERIIITGKELAKYFKVSSSTVSKWKREGVPMLRLGRSVRFDLNEVTEWVKGLNK